MRNLIIVRKRAIVGALMNYNCILNMESAIYNDEYCYFYKNVYEVVHPSDWPKPINMDSAISQYPIRNGEKLILPIEESSCTIFIASGAYFSNQLVIEAGNNDVYCLIRTRLDVKKLMLASVGKITTVFRITLTKSEI